MGFGGESMLYGGRGWGVCMGGGGYETWDREPGQKKECHGQSVYLLLFPVLVSE